MVFWEKIKSGFNSMTPSGGPLWGTRTESNAQEVPSKYACGATAAEKKARKEDGVARREKKGSNNYKEIALLDLKLNSSCMTITRP